MPIPDDDYKACLHEFDGDIEGLGASLDEIEFRLVRHTMSMKNEAAVMDARMVVTYTNYIPRALRIKYFSDAVRAGIIF